MSVMIDPLAERGRLRVARIRAVEEEGLPCLADGSERAAVARALEGGWRRCRASLGLPRRLAPGALGLACGNLFRVRGGGTYGGSARHQAVPCVGSSVMRVSFRPGTRGGAAAGIGRVVVRLVRGAAAVGGAEMDLVTPSLRPARKHSRQRQCSRADAP